MGIGRRHFLRLTGAAFAAPAVSRMALAQATEVTLKLHHGLPPIASIHTRLLTPWAKAIEQESGGRLKIVLYPSMQLGGTPAALYDQAREGMADIVWTMPGSVPGRFPAAETFELPFVADKHGMANARAAQDFCGTHLRDEFQDVQPLALCAADGGAIHSNRHVKSLDDVKAMKLRPPTRLAGEALKAAGAHPIAAPLSQVGDLLANKVMDGCIVRWEAVPAIRAGELTKFHTDFGAPTLTTTTFLLAMNKNKYAALSSDLKTVLDKNSGQHFANLAGAMFDERAAAVEEEVSKRGHSTTEFPPHETLRWRKATEPVVHSWLREMSARGANGEKLLADAKAVIAKYAGA
jgi:TRAP-type C4-dicarboxylate transport system substrate-binding protein